MPSGMPNMPARMGGVDVAEAMRAMRTNPNMMQQMGESLANMSQEQLDSMAAMSGMPGEHAFHPHQPVIRSVFSLKSLVWGGGGGRLGVVLPPHHVQARSNIRGFELELEAFDMARPSCPPQG